MLACQRSGDGLLTLEEFAAAFPEVPESQPATQEQLSQLLLQPMKVKELYEGAATQRKAAQPVPAAALAKFKFKLKAIKGFTSVWSNKGSGAHNDVSIWSPDIDRNSLQKRSHERVCLGHVAVGSFESPSKAIKSDVLTIEVTDTAVQHSLSSSEWMGAVVDQLLPPPLRFRLAWHDAHSKPPLYIWRGVPPSHDFLVLGMVVTLSEDPPELTALSCVPRRWCTPEREPPKCVWRHGGQVGGRAGSFWASGPTHHTLLAVQGQSEPPDELRWRLSTERFFADPSKLEDLIPQPAAQQTGSGRQSISAGNKGWSLPFGRSRSTTTSEPRASEVATTASVAPPPKPVLPVPSSCSSSRVTEPVDSVGQWLDSRVSDDSGRDRGESRSRLPSVSNPWETGTQPPPPATGSPLRQAGMPSPLQPLPTIPDSGATNPFASAPASDAPNPFEPMRASPPPAGAMGAPLDLGALDGGMHGGASTATTALRGSGSLAPSLVSSQTALPPGTTLEPARSSTIASPHSAAVPLDLSGLAMPHASSSPPGASPTSSATDLSGLAIGMAPMQPTPAMRGATPPLVPMQPPAAVCGTSPPLMSAPALQPLVASQSMQPTPHAAAVTPSPMMPAPMMPAPAPGATTFASSPPIDLSALASGTAAVAASSTGAAASIGALDPSLFAASSFAPAMAEGAVDRKTAEAAKARATVANTAATSLPGGGVASAAMLQPTPSAASTPPPPLMPTPATPAQLRAPTPDAAWQRLCLLPEGVLSNGPVLQLGFKFDCRGYAARVGIYYCNLATYPLQNLRVELVVPPATEPSLSANAANVVDALAPRGQTLQMASLELLSPFATPPYLAITWGGSGSACVNLPVLPLRFHSPWPLSKDDYFRLWRAGELTESQCKFTFATAHDMGAIDALLTGLRLATLKGVDPSPNNICAAGALALKSGSMPPHAGGHYCLLRLEVIPNYTTAADGTSRAASRLTVRATHIGIAEGLSQCLHAQLAGASK